jgi:hypothetical protein
MTDPKDVKIDPASSPGQGVTEAPPASTDVKPPAQPASPEPKHEDSIPYSRFKEQVDKMKQLESELAEERQLRESLAAAQPEEFDWNVFGAPAQPPAQPQSSPQQPYSPEEIEARLREDLANKPFQTMWPIIMEGVRQGLTEQKKKEAQVRTIPGFRDVENVYYEVPDEIIAQAQSNPEMIRFLLAKHRATVKQSAQPKTTTPPPPPAQSPGNGNPPVNMEELAEQYRAEGERRALEKLRNQQGVTAEGGHTYSPPASDDNELDDSGRSVMSKLGIPSDRMGKVANRLASFMKGE